MYIIFLFSVLHQQINCCFILVLANNQNIIMALVAHGGMIFYSARRGRRACSPLIQEPAPPLHTHRRPHKAGVQRSLMPPGELSLDFVSLPSCIFSGSDERWARLQRSAGPRHRVAALQSRDLDLPGPRLRFSSFIALSPGI